MPVQGEVIETHVLDLCDYFDAGTFATTMSSSMAAHGIAFVPIISVKNIPLYDSSRAMHLVFGSMMTGLSQSDGHLRLEPWDGDRG
jgi:hypothetical protein